MLLQLAASLPFCYVPRFYEPEYRQGRLVALNRRRPEVPETIEPSLLRDLDGTPLPTRPIVPFVECVHDRIAIEIMRGCPWQCRFCQSTVIKRPLRFRSVDTIVQGALESYRNTGFNEISILSLSSSDYPHFEQLMLRLKEVFGPLGSQHLGAQPARERTVADHRRADRQRASLEPDVGPRSCTRRHARADSQEDQE